MRKYDYVCTDFSEILSGKRSNKELARGGQCYYICSTHCHARRSRSDYPGALFPDSQIISGAPVIMQRNGARRMSRLNALLKGGYDILLATTVIEMVSIFYSQHHCCPGQSEAFGYVHLYNCVVGDGRSDAWGYSYFCTGRNHIYQNGPQCVSGHPVNCTKLGSGFVV
jgi:transcription-repair coupling factor (superfamily II helicase)